MTIQSQTQTQKPTYSSGKWRRLQRVVTDRGAFVVLAIDHRGPLRRALLPTQPAQVTDAQLAALKREVVATLGGVASAVLLDPELGIDAVLEANAIPRSVGLIVALDTGSSGDPHTLATGLVEGWSVERACQLGADGVKLLLYYHPDAPDAPTQRTLVERIARECEHWQMPLFLEPLPRPLPSKQGPMPVEEYTEVVLACAKDLVPLGVDVLKTTFPVNTKHCDDRGLWRAACAQLHAHCQVPWILLSGGISFDHLMEQVEIACEAGCSGVMVGRAVWQEAATLDLPTRAHKLQTTCLQRMSQLRARCDANATPLWSRGQRSQTPILSKTSN